MAGPSVVVKFLADVANLRQGMTQATGTSGRMAAGFRSLGSTVAIGLGTAAVVQFGRSAVTAAQESEVATARLETIFAQMGDTTGTAASQAAAYASELSKMIGVEDEVIMGAQAQLATFSNVSNETARAAGVFDRATAAAADLAAAGFGTMDTNSVQLGKALQDPINGLQALARSGVTFTQAQKDQIAAMQESGDLLGAQQVVLEAIEGQVQGTAAATVTESQKMSVAFGEVSESVGAALLPILGALAPMLMTVAKFLEENVTWILPLVAALGLFVIALKVATAVQTAFNLNLAISVGWIALIVVAVAALIAGFLWAYNNVEWFHNAVQAIWEALQVAWDAVVSAIGAAISWIADKFGWVATVIGVVVAAIKIYIKVWWTIVQTAWTVISTVIGWIGDRMHLVKTVIGVVVNAIRGYINVWIGAFNLIKNAATEVWSWIVGKFNAIVGFFSGIIGTIRGHLSSIASAIKGPINAVIRAWNGLAFVIPSFTLPEVKIGPVTFGGQTVGGQRFDFPNLPTLHSGGIVPGIPGSDVLALLQAGEMVVPRGGAGTRITVNATVQAPVDLDLLVGRLGAALTAGRFG